MWKGESGERGAWSNLLSHSLSTLFPTFHPTWFKGATKPFTTLDDSNYMSESIMTYTICDWPQGSCSVCRGRKKYHTPRKTKRETGSQQSSICCRCATASTDDVTILRWAHTHRIRQEGKRSGCRGYVPRLGKSYSVPFRSIFTGDTGTCCQSHFRVHDVTKTLTVTQILT